MIIETPNEFSPKAEWQKMLSELLKIDLSTLNSQDKTLVEDAIALAKAFLS